VRVLRVLLVLRVLQELRLRASAQRVLRLALARLRRARLRRARGPTQRAELLLRVRWCLGLYQRQELRSL